MLSSTRLYACSSFCRALKSRRDARQLAHDEAAVLMVILARHHILHRTRQVAGLKDELETERKKMIDVEKGIIDKLRSEASGTKSLEVRFLWREDSVLMPFVCPQAHLAIFATVEVMKPCSRCQVRVSESHSSPGCAGAPES